jgi:hypothetical protein
MSKHNRWNHVPDVEPQGDEFLASSNAFPGVYGEGETREEAIESFWEMVDFIGGMARAPDWPHDRSPYLDEWETVGDVVDTHDEDADDLPPWKVGDDDLPPSGGEPWKAD